MVSLIFFPIVDLLALGIFIFFAHQVFVRFEARRHFPLPPGPKGWPIIGNLFDLPREMPHIAYKDMGPKYQSDLIYLDVAGTSTLILNSVEAANDLLVGRSKVYSDRPPFTMLSLVGWLINFAFIPYGVKWRNHRSMFAREMSALNLSTYHKPRIQEGMSAFLNCMLETPQLFAEHIHLLFGGALLSTAYGITVKDSDDYYLKLVKESMRALAETGQFGRYIVDIFPILTYLPGWLPGMGFKKKAAWERQFVERMAEEIFGFSKRNTKTLCIASRLSQEMQDEGTWSKENEINLKELLAVFYAAGTDTTAITAKTVILALVRNSSILKKGQAAVDAAIGLDRLPDYGDEGKIPYVDAVIMEVLRWRAIVPTGVPHYTHSADIYRGYYIPAETTVFANAWAILNNPTTYGEDVDQFRPERFLNADGTLNPKVPYPDAAFGFGRRVCAGRALARSSIWLFVASVLACFDISKALNENGEEIDPSTDYLDGLLIGPRPFECIIQPRSKVVEELIRQKVVMEQ